LGFLGFWISVFFGNLFKDKLPKIFMKKVILFGLVVALLFLFSLQSVSAVQANNSANEVYRCGTLDVAGTYTLNQSFEDLVGGTDCLTFTSEDIDLNFAGFFIDGPGAGGKAVVISGYENITIRDGLINSSTTCLHLTDFNNSLLQNLTFNSCGDPGFNLRGLTNVTFESLNITGTNGQTSIKFQDAGAYNVTFRNNIVSEGNGPAIWVFDGVHNSTFYNNTFQSTGGIHFQSSTWNNFTENDALDTQSPFGALVFAGGMTFSQSSTDNKVIGGLINNSAGNGIRLGSGSNNTFLQNIVISNTQTDGVENNDLYVGSGSFGQLLSGTLRSLNVTALNVTYNFSKETVNGSTGFESELIRKWYVDIEVNNSLGYLSDADVNVTNSTPVNIFSESTGSVGNVSRMELVEYVNSAGTRAYATPHIINASKAYYDLNSTSYNLTEIRGATSAEAGPANVEHNVVLYLNSSVAHNLSNNVYQCGVIISPGSYTLNQSINHTVDSSCLTMGANSVVLDLYGNTLSGDGGYTKTGLYRGINVVNYNDTLIQNGTLTSFTYGIFFSGSGNNTLDNINSSVNDAGNQNDPRAGVVFAGGSNNTVKDSNFYGNYFGLLFDDVEDTDYPENNLIKNNTFSKNLPAGIKHSSNGANFSIYNNTFVANTQGVWFENSTNHSVQNNTFNLNSFAIQTDEDTEGVSNFSDNVFYRNANFAALTSAEDVNFSLSQIKNTMVPVSNFSTTSQNSTGETMIDFNLTMTYPNGTVCSSCTYDLDLYPSETSFQNSSSGENVMGNFTPTKVGIYSLKYNISHPDGGYESGKYIYLINATGEGQEDYYFLSRNPTNNQPANIPRWDAGSLGSSSPADCGCEGQRNCTVWTQFAVDNLPDYLFGSFNQINYSVWYDSSSHVTNYSGIQRFGYWDEIVTVDLNTSLDYTANEITNQDFNFSMNYANDYFWTWYWMTIKLRGVDPSVYSNSTYPSFANITYTYSNTPAIREINDTDTQLLAAYMNSNSSTNATIILDGTSVTNISVEMPDSSQTYLVLYDGLVCNSTTTDCTLNAQSSGILNITTALGSEHNLTIYYNAPAVTSEDTPESTSTGDGGAGISVFWSKGTHSISEEIFEKGFSKSLSERKRIQFEFEEEDHHVGIVELTNTTALIEVASTPQNATLAIGDERMFDITEDGFYDVLVKLNSIENNEADITLEKIHVEVTEETEEGEERKEAGAVGEEENPVEGSLWEYWIYFLVTLILIVVVFASFRRKRRKRKHYL
jgi:parallel beta-helix repeat protein